MTERGLIVLIYNVFGRHIGVKREGGRWLVFRADLTGRQFYSLTTFQEYGTRNRLTVTRQLHFLAERGHCGHLPCPLDSPVILPIRDDDYRLSC